jgi:hypothetical protein
LAAAQRPGAAHEEKGFVATARGDSAGSQGRGAGFGTSSSGRSENRLEIRRALITKQRILSIVVATHWRPKTGFRSAQSFCQLLVGWCDSAPKFDPHRLSIVTPAGREFPQ